LKLQTWNSGKWDIAYIFTARTVNVLDVCCGVNDTQLHFWMWGGGKNGNRSREQL